MNFLRLFKAGCLSFFMILLGKDLFSQNFDSVFVQKNPGLNDSETPNQQDETSFLSRRSLTALIPVSKVIIQGLDKITGRVLTMETMVGKRVDFGRLKIVIHRCYKAPPEEIPEAIVDIDIYEKGSGLGEDRLIFRNKMYASSPSVSALDHPIYDIWIKDCF